MSQQPTNSGKIIIVSGPSGVGKGTICREVVKRLPNVEVCVSLTTRVKSGTEVNGKDYRFVSKQQFQKLVNSNSLLEYAEVFGNLYGTPKESVERALAAGRTIVLEIDVQGARQAKASYPQAVMIFILPPTHKELKQRLTARGREEAGATERRLSKAEAEIAAAEKYYDHLVVNDNLDEAVRDVIEIVKS